MISVVYNSELRKLTAHGSEGPITLPDTTLTEQFEWLVGMNEDWVMTAQDRAALEADLEADNLRNGDD